VKIKLLIVILASLIFIFQCEWEECPECNEITGHLPAEDLLAYYPFNNNTDDESNNLHDGIIYGAEFTKDRLNNINRSLIFDGIDDFVELDTMASFNSSIESFSISFWMKGDTIGVTHYETLMKIINNDPSGTMFSIEIHRGPSSSLNIGVIRLDIRDNNDKYFTIYVDRPDIFDNDWHNLTFIISSAKWNQGDLYIDGELESKDDWFVRFGSESPEDFNRFEYNLTLGAGNNRGIVETYFKGCLDEIAFYGRPLKTIEILQLYNR
jgi:hypothetical protein